MVAAITYEVNVTTDTQTEFSNDVCSQIFEKKIATFV